MRRLAVLAIAMASLAPVGAERVPAPIVLSAVVDGVIHPVTADYMIHAIQRADAENAALLVFTLRTPGGLVDSTRDITTAMVAARTPIVVFIAPSGSRAASAGFIITMAADIAAMAPGTHIGAAHPVGGAGEKLDETMAKKVASDVAANARALASHRGRNTALVDQAVLESRSFTDQEAFKATPPLVEVIASDLNDLLRQLDGRKITRFDGQEQTLHLANPQIQDIEMTWRQKVLSAIAHPEVAYLLFTLGTLGLTIELWNPGSVVPGVAGAVCLLLAFFAFSILPINYAGLLLILLGLALLMLEVKFTSYGILGVGGVVSLVLGSLMLVDASAPDLRLSLSFVLPIALAMAAIIIVLVRVAVGAQRARVVTGREGMIGEIVQVLTAIAPDAPGQVRTHGEIWRARSSVPIAAGSAVHIDGIDGLTLVVSPRSSGSRETEGTLP